NLQGIRQIKAFGREAHEDSRFARRADDLRKGTLEVMLAWAAYSPAMSFAAALGSVLVLWLGGRQVLAGAMTLGELVGFLFYLALFYEPVARLHGLNQMLQAARAAGERIFDILDAPTERAAPNGAVGTPRPATPAETRRTLANSRSEVGRAVPTAPPAQIPAANTLRPPFRGEVAYENVSFGYNPERLVLRNISLHARPGEIVALAGPTGAGKSTLVNLLPAFYEATSGRILIDGQDISGISLQSL